MPEQKDQMKGGLALLELAGSLGSVTDACRKAGCSRSQYYKLRWRYGENGIDGLRPRSLGGGTGHPATTPNDVVERILGLSYEHPAWGCERISRCLAKAGTQVSPPTVHKILKREGLSTALERWLRLEGQLSGGEFEISPEQWEWLVHMNPSWAEPEMQRLSPGQKISVDTIRLGYCPGVGIVKAVAAVDARTNYAFVTLCTASVRNHAVLLLNNTVVPFLDERGARIKRVVTDGSREYAGDRNHPLETYLRTAGIEHDVRTTSKHLAGAMLRFRRAIRSEFALDTLPGELRSNDALARFRSDLGQWLRLYNETRPSLGLPNYGCPPVSLLAFT